MRPGFFSGYLFGFFASLIATDASACRCLTGNSSTTDAERDSWAVQMINGSDLAVIGTIYATPASQERSGYANDSGPSYDFSSEAVILIDEVVHGKTGAYLILPGGAGEGVYDGRIEHNLGGTCPASWRTGERNLYLMLRDANGKLVLASSCAHKLVRERIYPQFGKIDGSEDD